MPYHPLAGNSRNTQTMIGSLSSPLTLQTAFVSPTGASVTNNWGVDRNYQLGNIQTWNLTLTRDFKKNWTVMTGYTGTKGSSLDILRAPNRGPDGLRIPDVQAFLDSPPVRPHAAHRPTPPDRAAPPGYPGRPLPAKHRLVRQRLGHHGQQ